MSRSISVLRERLGAGTLVVGAGLAAILLGGALTALLAAALLPASEYTVFAAYSSLVGILALGPAGSLEQESSLRSSRAHDSTRRLLRQMMMRGLAIFAAVSLVVLSPAGGWQERLLGSSVTIVTVAVVLGTPVVFGAAVGRGYLTAHGSLGSVGLANGVTGIGLLVLPFVLRGFGVDWLSAFIVGAMLAWLPALVIIISRTRAAAARPPSRAPLQSFVGNELTAWLLAGNLLMITALLAVPVVLRWHVADLGAEGVAEAQLLVSISRLSSAAVLGLLALMVAQLATAAGASRVRRRWVLLASALGAVTVAVLVVLGDPLVSWITGSPANLSLEARLLATLPAATLCPAIVFMGIAIVRHRWGLIVVAWSAALVVLAGAAAFDPGGELVAVLGLIAVACSLPLLVLAAGLGLTRWTARRVSA